MKRIKILEIYATLLIAVVVALLYVWMASPLGTSDRVGITMAISTVALVIVTGIYAWHTRKMAEEMWKDRQQTSRPVIVIGCMQEPAFEICNDGSGPAVNLEIRVLDKDENCLDEKTVLFLRAGATMKFSPDIPLVNQAGSTCYLLCRYWTVLSKGTEPPRYRTGLPFEIRKSSRGQDKIIVSPAKLLFGDEAEKFLKKA